MATKAEIIDTYFSKQNHFPSVPYKALGETLVDVALNHTGKTNLWVSTAAALVEQESGGKNIFGCDRGGKWCREEVTEARVQALEKHFNLTGVSNGVGTTQLTYMPFIQQAEKLGGAHIIRNQMMIGFQHLNDLLNDPANDYLNALEAYNDGNPNWNNPQNSYDIDFAHKHRAWKNRLAIASDQPGEHGEAGDGAREWWPVHAPDRVPIRPVQPGNYTDRHPTRYDWRTDVRDVVLDLFDIFRNISINTYVDHPPKSENGQYGGRDRTSFDVWARTGRGAPIAKETGDAVLRYLFYERGAPYIEWVIWDRKIWTRGSGKWAPFGTDAFSYHQDHLHITYSGPQHY